MTNIQIKDVPADTHEVLARRARAAHQSLQEYLRSRLIQEASMPTVGEVFARAAARSGGSLGLGEAAAAIRADRDGR